MTWIHLLKLLTLRGALSFIRIKKYIRSWSETEFLRVQTIFLFQRSTPEYNQSNE